MSAMKKKVLLMGKSGSGKTSMRSIIFANYLARDTSRLNPTLDVEHSTVRFLGDLALNLWDCGGQDGFYKAYFERQRAHIFSHVELLIYVFDIESRDLEKDFKYYSQSIEALAQNSPDATVYCLIHKMDLIPAVSRQEVFSQRESLIKSRSADMEVVCFQTSIWDESLYKAWSAIVYSLIPNVSELEKGLDRFAEVMRADEVVLFERATFLVIAHVSKAEHPDDHRFEKVSNIIKQFKLSCSKATAQFKGMTVCNSRFRAFIEQFTSHTYVMVVTSNLAITDAATLMNISEAQRHFEKFMEDKAVGGGGGSGVTSKKAT